MKLPALSALSAFLLLGAAGTLPANAPEETHPPVVTITIGLIGDSITASPDPAVANRGEEVVFRADPNSAIETLNIRFRSPVPFGGDASRNGMNGNRQNAARGNVQAGAEVGRRYKYMIRVFNGQRTIVRDPEIEIGPSELR